MISPISSSLSIGEAGRAHGRMEVRVSGLRSRGTSYWRTAARWTSSAHWEKAARSRFGWRRFRARFRRVWQLPGGPALDGARGKYESFLRHLSSFS
jgi:hypothetical protein